eukprot:gene22784-17189_t
MIHNVRAAYAAQAAARAHAHPQVRQSTASEMQRNAMRLLTTNQKKLLGYTADAQAARALQQRHAAAAASSTAKLTPLQAYHLREAARRRGGGLRRGGE